MQQYLTILLIFLALNAGSQPATTQHVIAGAQGPQFNFFNNDRAHDFGSIMINGNAEYKFEFRNSGNQPLIIKEIHSVVKGINTPQYKVLINYPKDAIRPGKISIITALVVAQANTGPFKCEVLVTSNATTPDYPLLLLSGTIVPEHGDIKPVQKEPIIPVEFLTPIIGAVK